MSEIQKAIDELKTMYFPMHSHDKTIQMAISALQDQAEREKGCELCNGEMLSRVEISKSFGEMRIALLSGGHPDEQSKFKFCPNCGRDLREPVSE